MEAAIQELLKKAAELEAERHRVNNEFNAKISELNKAIEHLSGKKVWEVVEEYKYDDESPSYITNNEDGV